MRCVALTAALTMMLSIGIAGAESVLDKSKRDGIVNVERGDPHMAVAYKRARETLPGFLKLAGAPRPTTKGFAVKVPVPYGAGNDAESFWIAPFEQRGDRYAGRINNTPRLAKT